MKMMIYGLSPRTMSEISWESETSNGTKEMNIVDHEAVFYPIIENSTVVLRLYFEYINCNMRKHT